MPECQEQYEILRSQALKPTAEEVSGPKNIDVAFIECQGLVAWIEGGPESDLPTDGLATVSQQARILAGDLVSVLANFIVGQPQEAENGG